MRAGETCPGWPRGALTSVLATALALCAWAVALEPGLALGPAYLPKALAAYGLIATLVLMNLETHRPCERFGSANQLTLARAALVALLVGLLGEAPTATLAWSAAAIALLVGALDGLDGRLARGSGLASDFGARFDMETDALLIAVLALLAWQLDKAGPWVLLAGLMRYGFLAAGALLPWLRRPLPPSRRRQRVCVLQVLTLVVCLLPALPAPGSAAVAACGLATLAYSFALDILWLARQAEAAGATR